MSFSWNPARQGGKNEGFDLDFLIDKGQPRDLRLITCSMHKPVKEGAV